jgi:hypothetical protein
MGEYCAGIRGRMLRLTRGEKIQVRNKCSEPSLIRAFCKQVGLFANNSTIGQWDRFMNRPSQL